MQLAATNGATPSRTALRVALRRAAHQLVDRPLVFEDPFAVSLLGQEYAAEIRRTPQPAPDRRQRAYSISMRAYLVARSRYAEESLAEGIAGGATQYVLLGAGLDTFAQRNPYRELRVFEVDHPATQLWKRTLLARSKMAEPSGLTYVPVDFERQSLAEAMCTVDFDTAAATVFAWLGVVPYLTLGAFRSTLAFIARSAPGSGVIFDYGLPRHVLSPIERLGHDSLAARVASVGEPFQLFFTPGEAARELAGFERIEDLDWVALNDRYFSDRGDNLQIVRSSGHIVSAWLPAEGIARG